jgi:hypothetical protein
MHPSIQHIFENSLWAQNLLFWWRLGGVSESLIRRIRTNLTSGVVFQVWATDRRSTNRQEILLHHSPRITQNHQNESSTPKWHWNILEDVTTFVGCGLLVSISWAPHWPSWIYGDKNCLSKWHKEVGKKSPYSVCWIWSLIIPKTYQPDGW